MALTALDKMNVQKYIKEHAMGDLYYGNMRETLGRRKDKVSDLEFLDYFTEYVVNELRKDEKISVKHLSKVVSCVEAILGWVHNENQPVTEETLDKIRSFREFYDEYLERTGIERDETLSTDYIDSVVSEVNELYPVDSIDTESVSKYINKVAELEKQIKKLEKDLTEASRIYNSLDEEHQKKCSKLAGLKETVQSLEKDVREKGKEIINLNETIITLGSRIEELETSLNKATITNVELSSYKEQYGILSEEVGNLKTIIENAKKEKDAEAKAKAKHLCIESLVYQKLLLDRCSIDDLVRYIKEHKVDANNVEVADALRCMKKVITLDSSRFSNKPSYKIVRPELKEDGVFEIEVPYGCKHYDVMLVSDFHVREVDAKLLKGYDVLTNYCVRNGISLMLNLGDFYNGFSSHPLDYENAMKNYRVIEQTISELPVVDGLYHAVLGGNHEKNISNYGFDPVEMMSDARSDFLNLGYTHSTVTINSPTTYLGSFDIHHPDGFDFPIKLEEDGIDITEMNSYLEDIYASLGKDRDESYIDIFGHTHVNQFNYPGGYCYIPSYFDGGSKRGACHLRIYFDEETDIKYMVFMPLSFSTGTRLDKTNEIVYQKVLTRKNNEE